MRKQMFRTVLPNRGILAGVAIRKSAQKNLNISVTGINVEVNGKTTIMGYTDGYVLLTIHWDNGEDLGKHHVEIPHHIAEELVTLCKMDGNKDVSFCCWRDSEGIGALFKVGDVELNRRLPAAPPCKLRILYNHGEPSGEGLPVDPEKALMLIKALKVATKGLAGIPKTLVPIPNGSKPSRIILPGGVVGLIMPVKAKSAEFPAELIMDEEGTP